MIVLRASSQPLAMIEALSTCGTSDATADRHCSHQGAVSGSIALGHRLKQSGLGQLGEVRREVRLHPRWAVSWNLFGNQFFLFLGRLKVASGTAASACIEILDDCPLPKVNMRLLRKSQGTRSVHPTCAWQ